MQCVPQTKLHIRYTTDLLILYREMNVDFTEIQTKHKNSLCAENVKLLHTKLTCMANGKLYY
jgi:hypothetical protein